MRWIEVAVPTQSAEIDALCLRLEDMGVEGFCIEDEADFRKFLENNHKYWDYVDQTLDERFNGLSRIKFYLPDDAEGQALLEEIKSTLDRTLDIGYINDEDWENSWKASYQPLYIGDKLLVVPDWLDPELDGRVALRLEPGLTFGTGSHATTRMCLEALETYAASGKKVLDLGCGSGILGIGALVLGCECAVGCDVDPKSPEMAASNAALNGIGSDRFAVYAGDILTDEGMRKFLGSGYDIVFANIVADVIIPLSAIVRRFMAEGAVMICSGIIDDRAAEVEAELQKNGFRILRHLHEEEWHAFVAE